MRHPSRSATATKLLRLAATRCGLGSDWRPKGAPVVGWVLRSLPTMRGLSTFSLIGVLVGGCGNRTSPATPTPATSVNLRSDADRFAADILGAAARGWRLRDLQLHTGPRPSLRIVMAGASGATGFELRFERTSRDYRATEYRRDTATAPSPTRVYSKEQRLLALLRRGGPTGLSQTQCGTYRLDHGYHSVRIRPHSDYFVEQPPIVGAAAPVQLVTQLRGLLDRGGILTDSHTRTPPPGAARGFELVLAMVGPKNDVSLYFGTDAANRVVFLQRRDGGNRGDTLVAYAKLAELRKAIAKAPSISEVVSSKAINGGEDLILKSNGVVLFHLDADFQAMGPWGCDDGPE